MTLTQDRIGAEQTSLMIEFLFGWLVVVLYVAPVARDLNFIFLPIPEACVLCVLFLSLPSLSVLGIKTRDLIHAKQVIYH